MFERKVSFSLFFRGGVQFFCSQRYYQRLRGLNSIFKEQCQFLPEFTFQTGLQKWRWAWLPHQAQPVSTFGLLILFLILVVFVHKPIKPFLPISTKKPQEKVLKRVNLKRSPFTFFVLFSMFLYVLYKPLKLPWYLDSCSFLWSSNFCRSFLFLFLLDNAQSH